MDDDDVVQVWFVAGGDPPQAAPAVRQPRVSAPLSPYTGTSARCAKCGNNAGTDEGISTQYIRTPDLEEAARRQAHVMEVLFHHATTPTLPAFLADLAAGQEVLARACGQCSYVWVEATLDDPTLALGELS